MKASKNSKQKGQTKRVPNHGVVMDDTKFHFILQNQVPASHLQISQGHLLRHHHRSHRCRRHDDKTQTVLFVSLFPT